MRKNFRMLLGIILHPYRIIRANLRRGKYESIIRKSVRENWWKKNHERMHDMSEVTNTGYTESELYKNLYRGALD